MMVTSVVEINQRMASLTVRLLLTEILLNWLLLLKLCCKYVTFLTSDDPAMQKDLGFGA